MERTKGQQRSFWGTVEQILSLHKRLSSFPEKGSSTEKLAHIMMSCCINVTICFWFFRIMRQGKKWRVIYHQRIWNRCLNLKIRI